MQLALVQFDPGPDTDANVERATAFVREAASSGADLVVLPEIWNVGYFAFDEYETGAEPLDGPTVSRFRDLAAELDIHLHAGSIVERDGENLYNTNVLIGPDGDVLDTYRKIHLFGYESQESQLLTPGDRIVTVDTELGTMGMVTCYDLRFPELFRAMRDDGADLVLVSSAWPHERLSHWLLLNRTRAMENQVFLAAANLVGENEGVRVAGNSLVVDPWGIPRVNGGGEERLLQTEIDLTEAHEAREEFPVLDDRRIDLTYDLGPGR